MNRNAAYVALGFVTLASLGALNVVWRVGHRVERELAELSGSALPGLTQLAIEYQSALALLVLAAFVGAVLVHRQRFAVLALVLIGFFQLVIAGAYGFALWLPYLHP